MTGKQLKIKLIQLGLTQYQLAKELNINIKTVNKLCNSNRIAKVYQLAIERLEHQLTQ